MDSYVNILTYARQSVEILLTKVIDFNSKNHFSDTKLLKFSAARG